MREEARIQLVAILREQFVEAIDAGGGRIEEALQKEAVLAFCSSPSLTVLAEEAASPAEGESAMGMDERARRGGADEAARRASSAAFVISAMLSSASLSAACSSGSSSFTRSVSCSRNVTTRSASCSSCSCSYSMVVAARALLKPR